MGDKSHEITGGESLEPFSPARLSEARESSLPRWQRKSEKTGKIEVQCCVCWSFFPPMTPEDPETTCPSCIARIRAFCARKSADTFDKRFQKKIEDFRNGTDTETVRISRKTREKIEIILLENHLLESKDQLIDNILNSWCESFDKARNPPPIYKTEYKGGQK